MLLWIFAEAAKWPTESPEWPKPVHVKHWPTLTPQWGQIPTRRPTSQNDDSNLALILGITIPCAVIIIVALSIFGIIFYKRRSSMSDSVIDANLVREA